MLDLTAALDCVDHAILLRRLHSNFGLVQPIIDWVKSYLTGRSQIVKCGSDLLSVRAVYCGVPQGSVLGALLFLLYTAELLEVILARGLAGHAYADDTQLYRSCLPS